MISAREQHLMDTLDLALNVIHGLSAQLWEARLATVAAMSLLVRQTYDVTPCSPMTATASSPDPALLAADAQPVERPSDSSILAALANGPRRGSAVARYVFQTASLTASQRAMTWRALHDLTLTGKVVYRNRFYRLPQHAATVAAPEEEIAS